jgi:hypothetical protein
MIGFKNINVGVKASVVDGLREYLGYRPILKKKLL